MNETKQAGKVNATEQQILFWFRNRRRENKIKRDPNYCDGDSSEISDGGGIWITDTPPTKPQTRNLFEEIDEHDNMNNVISHEDESLDNPSETEFGWRPRLKPSKEQLGWKRALRFSLYVTFVCVCVFDILSLCLCYRNQSCVRLHTWCGDRSRESQRVRK